ncbi:uncharacterized protein BCR38DRAFT_349771 [Pseudomassariella vexata]|uniref:Transferase family-domain-containing protein n=1 Tax=Pseudomassariella vexata TaxID=1141098 RepID=A0A1Y2DP14_9PEZI|nr:uncharacterized protein BCR38DRAFT_349771 [Pseudomassariella vexata]ORY61018.1 hypothetical protein BCR38DRAFT_349771 [Pseudomassariella vexata]
MLKNLTAPKRVQPPRIDTDEVIPMFYFDEYWRWIIMSKTIRFNDVLDVDKLHSTLSHLCTMGEWRKLGGRLRKNSAGHYEIHVPREFTSKRPAVGFSKVSFDTSIEDHPVASKMPNHPTLADKPSIQCGPEELKGLNQYDGSPRSIDDFLYSDRPQLHLHTVSFGDATLVTYTWSHSLMDACGMQALYEAWSLVLGGKESQVKPLAGYKDAMADFGLVQPPKPWLFESIVMGMFSMIFFGLRWIISNLGKAKPETKAIFIPARMVQKLRTEGLNQVPDVDEKGNKMFLSEGDILLAWITRTVCLDEPLGAHRDVIIGNALDLRTRLPNVFSPEKSYVQNAIFMIYTVEKLKKVVQGTVGSLALHIRKLIVEQVKEDQLEAEARLTRVAKEKFNTIILVGSANSVLVMCSNWTKAKFFEALDFGPAVLKQGQPDETRVNGLGKPAYFYWNMLNDQPLGMKNVINIMGKDAEGNYWVLAVLGQKQWQNMEVELARR